MKKILLSWNEYSSSSCLEKYLTFTIQSIYSDDIKYLKIKVLYNENPEITISNDIMIWCINKNIPLDISFEKISDDKIKSYMIRMKDSEQYVAKRLPTYCVTTDQDFEVIKQKNPEYNYKKSYFFVTQEEAKRWGSPIQILRFLDLTKGKMYIKKGPDFKYTWDLYEVVCTDGTIKCASEFYESNKHLRKRKKIAE